MKEVARPAIWVRQSGSCKTGSLRCLIEQKLRIRRLRCRDPTTTWIGLPRLRFALSRVARLVTDCQWALSVI